MTVYETAIICFIVGIIIFSAGYLIAKLRADLKTAFRYYNDEHAARVEEQKAHVNTSIQLLELKNELDRLKDIAPLPEKPGYKEQQCYLEIQAHVIGLQHEMNRLNEKLVAIRNGNYNPFQD